MRFDGGIGERDYRPTSAAELPADGYDLGVGQMTVDLRGLDWPRDRSVEVDTDMGVGQTVVSVPARGVEADANASVGHVLVRGREGSGIDAEVTEGPPVGDAPRLVLDAEIDAGEIVVTDRRPRRSPATAAASAAIAGTTRTAPTPWSRGGRRGRAPHEPDARPG